MYWCKYKLKYMTYLFDLFFSFFLRRFFPFFFSLSLYRINKNKDRYLKFAKEANAYFIFFHNEPKREKKIYMLSIIEDFKLLHKTEIKLKCLYEWCAIRRLNWMMDKILWAERNTAQRVNYREKKTECIDIYECRSP